MGYQSKGRAERRVREPISFLIYDLILIVLAYMTPDTLVKLLCVILSVLTAIRAIQMFADLMLGDEQLVEDNFHLHIGGHRHNLTQ